MKKARKFVAMLMTAAMSASLLAGCGGSGSTAGTDGSAAGSSSAENASSVTESSADDGTTEDGEDVSDAEQVLYVGSAYDASTLDPAMATDDGSYNVIRLTGEPLLRLVLV